MTRSICVAAVSFLLLSLLATVAHAIQIKNGPTHVFYDSLENGGVVGTDPTNPSRDPTAFGGVGLPWTETANPGDTETTRTILNAPAPANHGDNFLEINRTGAFGEPDAATANFTQQTTGVLTSEFAFRIRDFGPANEQDLVARMFGNGNTDLIGGIRIAGTVVQLIESGGNTNIGLNINDMDWHTALFTYNIDTGAISLEVDGGNLTNGTAVNNADADAWQFPAPGPSTIVDYDAVGPIPEPSTVVLIALGIVGLLARARPRRR